MSEQGKDIIARGNVDRARVLARFERNLAIIAAAGLLVMVGCVLIQPALIIVALPGCLLAIGANFVVNYEALDRIQERVMREIREY